MGDKKIRGGALIARALRDKGIDNVFTLSGGNIIHWLWSTFKQSC